MIRNRKRCSYPLNTYPKNGTAAFIRFPAAKDRALRGALGKGPPRARLLPELYGGKLAYCAQ